MKQLRAYLCCGAFVLCSGISGPADAARQTLLGTAVVPAHFPESSPQEVQTAFDEAAAIGSNDTIISDWKDDTSPEALAGGIAEARKRGLKVHLYLSPISLDAKRDTPSIPAGVPGKSFADATVRAAFKTKAPQYAGLRPDYLGLGTEVNLLEQNPAEFAAYASLATETYQFIKQKFPNQTVTISFQWDVMIMQRKFESLAALKNAVDVFSFTSYPGVFGTADKLPATYYSSVRRLLPHDRVGFSEIGWSAATPQEEAEQARYFQRLPALMKDARPEFVTLALLHDVKAFGGGIGALNSVGVRHFDGTPKAAWDVVLRMDFKDCQSDDCLKVRQPYLPPPRGSQQ